MDSIYANAQVTIIAAQSKVQGTGLQGVSEKQPCWPTCNIGGSLIAPVLHDSSLSVGKSKWVTRGWTYQEGILSKRRLIFTDEQIFFKCNGMKYAESQVQPLKQEESGDFAQSWSVICRT
ncbi:hypothetical protein G7Y89_g8964 [Cudoniella acicularis]|uniref:Heterokaryon incompatibility domain-containing protein n=1 Tax=Cudoniella acicularis TaxID=354080 RepID=A0A8H4RHR3_9HELO|nr:hypothetical protein G7Y89_g8964 [Cudoniella acicularis]